MMLAHGVERNILYHDHFLMTFVKQRLEMRRRVLRKAGKHFLIHTSNARGSLAQAFAIGVFAHAFQNQTNALFDFLCIHNSFPSRQS